MRKERRAQTMASVGKRDKKVARPPCSLERQLIKRPSTKRKQRGADRVKPFTQAPRDATVHSTKFKNLYEGHRSRPGPIEKISLVDATPESFWEKFISKRKPLPACEQVIIVGHPSDPSWKASTRWTNDYLIQQAGSTKVRVEVRSSTDDAYGRGNKVDMLFGEFVQEVSKGNNKLYLTTQDAAVAKDGFPELLSRPVQDLARDIPLCPALLGGLVPQSINMWMGCSPDGSSTGLHHDFHDNLYVLLRGRKRFRLYSPNMADLMLTNGELQMVHPNGRIVYKGDGRIRADGAEVHDAAAWEARHKAETELAGASCHDDSDVDEDDSAMEAALDMMLDGAMENSPVLEDDFVDSGDEGDSGSEPTWIEEPSSFSSIDLQLDDEELQRMHQAFPGKWAASVADVSAGEMLYLPAGWFHEVTSVGGPEAGGHLALNYWMHPPDNLHASPSDSPYVHLLWPALWQKRVKHMPAYVAAGDAKDEPITPECRLCKDSVGKSGKHRKNTKAGGRPTAPWPAGVSKSQPNKSHALGSAGPEASNKNVNKEHISGFGDVDSWFGAQSGCHQSLAVQEDMLSMVLSSSMSHAPSSKNTKKKRKRRGNSHAE